MHMPKKEEKNKDPSNSRALESNTVLTTLLENIIMILVSSVTLYLQQQQKKIFKGEK